MRSANGARERPTSEFGSQGRSFVEPSAWTEAKIAIAMGRVEAETDDADDSSETSSSQSLRATAFTLNGSTWEFENPVFLVLAAAASSAWQSVATPSTCGLPMRRCSTSTMRIRRPR